MSKSVRYEPYRATDGLSPQAQALLAYVRKRDFVSYAEMGDVLRPFIPVDGHLAAEVGGVANLVLWMGMSQAWADTLKELSTAGLLWREPCSLLVYLVDGAVLPLPVAKHPPKGGYATPHWAPSCVRPIEHITPRERKRYGTAPAGRMSAGKRG